ncbi:hypothetical protein AB8899_18145 [Yersinia enterocolitica]|uniref:hypothetical protein n=1 Tax=Yersinia enterocolitica TaxID=630 RepID=UPI0005E2A13A|nr:hypothetical protein [Yersinia enterocolitica]EKN3889859.1 hypothetical protein [Yersinia enterocolitica]EKN3955515.1 hypothetical protein [Yersinia enterocolitica]EKN3997047.1 hypothetical protein [Yersinia enterocolitica]EKN4892768.1 hypothetical protein [Yersinia enterocolitica]EKN5064949.1 hypothetical protein [Yersinia enterocolitica]
MDNSILVFGTIFAAFMAGVFSLFTLINNKEQKVSEFRQAWIDGLRKDISGLVASIFYISYCHSTLNGNNSMAPKDIESSHKQYVEACTSLLTRINAQDPDLSIRDINKAFLDALNNIQNAFNAKNYSNAAILTKELIDSSKPLLKAEWERVKSGEKTYKRTKLLAWGLSISGLILATIFLFANYKVVGEISIQQLKSGSTPETTVVKSN